MLEEARTLHLDTKMSVLGSELSILAEFAKSHHNIVEVGTWVGRSARALADNTPGQLHCVDPWDGLCHSATGWGTETNAYNREFKAFLRNLKDHIDSGKVKFFKGKYEDFWLDNPDMVFIDGIHNYDDVKRDILHTLKMMKYGLICGHDYAYYWPGVEKAVKEIFPTSMIKVRETIWYVELQ